MSSARTTPDYWRQTVAYNGLPWERRDLAAHLTATGVTGAAAAAACSGPALFEEGEWVTIGGGPGDKGEQHKGGFRVQVGKDGTIQKGMGAGKTIQQIGRELSARGREAVRAAGRQVDATTGKVGKKAAAKDADKKATDKATAKKAAAKKAPEKAAAKAPDKKAPDKKAPEKKARPRKAPEKAPEKTPEKSQPRAETAADKLAESLRPAAGSLAAKNAAGLDRVTPQAALAAAARVKDGSGVRDKDKGRAAAADRARDSAHAALQVHAHDLLAGMVEHHLKNKVIDHKGDGRLKGDYAERDKARAEQAEKAAEYAKVVAAQHALRGGDDDGTAKALAEGARKDAAAVVRGHRLLDDARRKGRLKEADAKEMEAGLSRGVNLTQARLTALRGNAAAADWDDPAFRTKLAAAHAAVEQAKKDHAEARDHLGKAKKGWLGWLGFAGPVAGTADYWHAQVSFAGRNWPRDVLACYLAAHQVADDAVLAALAGRPERHARARRGGKRRVGFVEKDALGRCHDDKGHLVPCGDAAGSTGEAGSAADKGADKGADKKGAERNYTADPTVDLRPAHRRAAEQKPAEEKKAGDKVGDKDAATDIAGGARTRRSNKPAEPEVKTPPEAGSPAALAESLKPPADQIPARMSLERALEIGLHAMSAPPGGRAELPPEARRAAAAALTREMAAAEAGLRDAARLVGIEDYERRYAEGRTSAYHDSRRQLRDMEQRYATAAAARAAIADAEAKGWGDHHAQGKKAARAAVADALVAGKGEAVTFWLKHAFKTEKRGPTRAEEADITSGVGSAAAYAARRVETLVRSASAADWDDPAFHKTLAAAADASVKAGRHRDETQKFVAEAKAHKRSWKEFLGFAAAAAACFAAAGGPARRRPRRHRRRREPCPAAAN